MKKLGIIIEREYTTRVKKKSFIFTTLFVPIIIGVVFFLIIYMSMSSISHEKIVVIDDTGLYADVLQDDDNYTFVTGTHTLDEYKQESTLDEEEATAVLHIRQNLLQNPKGWSLYSFKKLPDGVVQYVNQSFSDYLVQEKMKQYDIPELQQIMDDLDVHASVPTYQWQENGESSKTSGTLAGMIGMAMSIIIMTFLTSYASMVMNGVLEEKKSRIMEIIVSSVRPLDMMIGKIVGIFLVGLTQVALWLIFGGVIFVIGSIIAIGGVYDISALSQIDPGQLGGMAAGMDASSIIDMQQSLEVVQSINFGQLILMLIIFFIGGYLLYGSLFAALGASVSSDEDAGQFLTPFMLIMMVGFYIAMGSIDNPDGSMAFWGSMIPFTSPFVMLMRIPYGVATWELLLSIGLLLGTAFGIAWLAARIYRVGILFTGKKPSVKDLWSWLFL